MRGYLTLYGRALVWGTSSLWGLFGLVISAGLYGLGVWFFGLTAPIAIAAAVLVVLVAGQVGALRIAHADELLLAQWQGREVSPAHDHELRHMLGSAAPDVAGGKPVLFGDRPGLPRLYRKMIEEHFPQVTGRVDAWNALATRVANALDMLRKLIEDAVRVRLTDPRYDKDELTRRIIEFVSNRAMRRQLGLPLDQPPGQGHVWFHRALIAMEIQGHRVIELGNIPDDEYEETRENLMGLVDDLIEDAQRSKWAIEVQDANQALMSDSAGSDLLEAIHAEQIRERIFVAAGCPACGVVPRGS